MRELNELTEFFVVSERPNRTCQHLAAFEVLHCMCNIFYRGPGAKIQVRGFHIMHMKSCCFPDAAEGGGSCLVLSRLVLSCLVVSFLVWSWPTNQPTNQPTPRGPSILWGGGREEPEPHYWAAPGTVEKLEEI